VIRRVSDPTTDPVGAWSAADVIRTIPRPGQPEAVARRDGDDNESKRPALRFRDSSSVGLGRSSPCSCCLRFRLGWRSRQQGSRRRWFHPYQFLRRQSSRPRCAALETNITSPANRRRISGVPGELDVDVCIERRFYMLRVFALLGRAIPFLVVVAIAGCSVDPGNTDDDSTNEPTAKMAKAALCYANGATCSTSSICCSGHCTSGVCTANGCFGNGSSCSSNSVCCSGRCAAGTCTSTCYVNGATCSVNSDCCSGHCISRSCSAR
jgi:hypothetical protein